MKIYIVRGPTGEYSDRSEWVVCAYPNKRDAEKHADLAKIELHRIYKEKKEEFEVASRKQWEEWEKDPKEHWLPSSSTYENFYGIWDKRDFGKHPHALEKYLKEINWELDPDIQIDYSGVDYYVEECTYKERFEK